MNGPRPINTQGAKRRWLDVTYATTSPAQKLDIYLPNAGNGPFPVILAIHGGGFEGGDKNTGEVNSELTGLNRGYAVVSVNYRLSGEAPFPAAVKDVKAAVRFLRANAAKYQLDPGKIAAWGGSAGGNLASMLGTTSGVKDLEDLAMGNPGQPSNVQAVVDWFGPTNFLTMDLYHSQAGRTVRGSGHNGPTSAESRYIGAHITTVPAQVIKADPTTYISPDTPPFFIEGGTQDPVVPLRQNAQLAAEIAWVIGKDKVTFITLQGAGHGGPPFEAPDNLDKVFAFLDRYLK